MKDAFGINATDFGWYVVLTPIPIPRMRTAVMANPADLRNARKLLGSDGKFRP
jgi:hypothetical protein